MTFSERVAVEAIDAHQVARPFGRGFGLAEGQAAAPRFRHQLRHPAAGETRGIGVLVVNPDVHVQPFGLLEGDLPEPEPVGGQVRRHQPRARVDPDLFNLLGGQVAQGVADLLLGEQVVPDPKRPGAVFPRRILEKRLYPGRFKRRARRARNQRSAENGKQHQGRGRELAECIHSKNVGGCCHAAPKRSKRFMRAWAAINIRCGLGVARRWREGSRGRAAGQGGRI